MSQEALKKNEKLLQAIATHLGATIVRRSTSESIYEYGELTMPNHPGSSLMVHFGAYRKDDRVIVRPSYPRTNIGEQPSPRFYLKQDEVDALGGEPESEITCSASRPPEAIANDIQRKILNQYLPLLDRVVQGNAARKEQWQKNVSTIEKLANIAGASFQENPREMGQTFTKYAGKRGQLKASVRWDGEVEIETGYLTAEEAEQVMHLLAKIRSDAQA